MNPLVFALAVPWLLLGLSIALGAWIAFQLIHQNGRMLARLETLDQRLRPPERDSQQAPAAPAAAVAPASAQPDPLSGQILARLQAIEQHLSAPPPAAPLAPSSPSGLPVGAVAPDFALPDLTGRRTSLSDFHGRDLLLIFFNPGCGFCSQMAADLARLPVDGAVGEPLPLVLSTGGAAANRKLVEEYGVRCPVLLQDGMEIASQYQCNGTPMGYRIDPQGKIASELAVGAQALLALAGDARQPAPAASPDDSFPAHANGHASAALGGKRSLEESKLQRNGLPAGIPAPDFRLPLLYGGELALEEYRGRKVLLVFSDPNCGPCQALAPELEQAARRTPGVQVLMVTRGAEEANRVKAADHGLTFPIVMQQQWEISREYGMFATPIAYLIDETGVIAGEVSVGVESILALHASAAAPADAEVPRCRCGKPIGQCQCGQQKTKAATARRNGR